MIMNPIRKLFDILFDYYGPQMWWPCQTSLRWEIISGAILTQNTAWTNVEKAIGNFFRRGDVAGACSGDTGYGLAGVDSSGGIFHAEVRLFESDGVVYA